MSASEPGKWDRVSPMPVKSFMEFRYIVCVVCGVRCSNVVSVGCARGEEVGVDEVEGGVRVKNDDDGVVIWSSIEGNGGSMDFSHVIVCWHCAHRWWKDVGSIV